MVDKPKKPITDVQKPGKTPAGATSRPIIVGHGIPLKDPMVTDDVKTEAPEPAKTTKAIPKIVKPLSEPETPAKTAKEVPTKSELETDESSVSDQAVVDAVVGKASDKKQAEKDAEELHKRLELVEQLVQSKKYFVPIDVAAKKRTHRIELSLFVLLLAVAVGTVLAVDAGVINTDIKLPFDLIK